MLGRKSVCFLEDGGEIVNGIASGTYVSGGPMHGMSNASEDVELLREAGAYDSEAAVIEDALRSLLRTKPELRLALAVEKYRTGRVSHNRAADIAGLSPTEFAEHLHERGIPRDAGFLSDDERDEKLSDL